MKASAVLNDKDVWAISSQPSTNQSFLFSSFFLMGELKKRWLLRLMAARPVSRMKKLMELIYEWSLKGRVWWMSWCWLMSWMGGLWAAQQPMAPPKKANINKQHQQIQSNKKKERERNEINLSLSAPLFLNEVKKRGSGESWLNGVGHQRASRGGKPTTNPTNCSSWRQICGLVGGEFIFSTIK